ncbi:hypothetical protein PIB30_066941 [Stylosanthes scabra]|uniref:Uncharacterized protein n=1 Tax=Stylosanthes scabra TaxID=79078 RepID=A0ABU6ZL59_9FABA|nr:hypothetical protein [Stylosanthes scabra]
MIFLVGCGFRDFYNHPIIPLPPEFPGACLRRLGGFKRLFSAFSHFSYSFFLLSFFLKAYLFFEMVKKKSCQNVHNPRVLSPVERELYGWVDAEVFTQSAVLASEHLPELRREMRLARNLASERDFV